jgi:hypothetical protein
VLQETEAAFGQHQALVPAGGVFYGDAIVAGFDHPFAVMALRFPDFAAIDAHLSFFEIVR